MIAKLGMNRHSAGGHTKQATEGASGQPLLTAAGAEDRRYRRKALSGPCDLLQIHPSCGAACWNSEANRLAHVPAQLREATKANGEEVKVVQESLPDAHSRITLDVYTQAVSAAKRQAQSKVVKMILPGQNSSGKEAEA